MKKINSIFRVMVLFAIVCAVLSACAGSPEPAAVVNEPAPTAQPSAPADQLDTAVRETSDYLNNQLPKGNKLMILNVQSDYPALSEYIIDELIANTVNDRIFTVVDRNQLNTIRAELNFQMSGEVDDETAQSLGRMAGAQIIISGAVSKIGDLYRLRIRALSVQSAQIEGQFNRNIPEGETILALVNSKATGYGDGTAVARSNSPQTTTSAPTSLASPAAPSLFSVMFNANGANGTAPATQTVQSGESIVLPDAGTLTKTANIFNGWNTNVNGSGTSYKSGDDFEVTRSIQLFAQWVPDANYVYKIGDTGPAGGIIFYDKGTFSDGWRYLEAAPASTEQKDIQWSVSGFNTGARGVEAGTGKLNTQNIMDASYQVAVNAPAARYCDRLEYGGYDDWYLPSKNELGLMYMNLKIDGLGGFGAGIYWSSTESGNRGGVFSQQFSNGVQMDSDGGTDYFAGWKGHKRSVRAIRQF